MESSASRRSIDIVVTTIFEPGWLPGYLENIKTFGYTDEVTIRIVCDRKTPRTVFEQAEIYAAEGFRIDCPTLDEQETYAKRLGLPEDFIPWNSDNRRNIGFLRSWESGADVLISIDDDNYCRPDSDFVGSHSAVGRRCIDLDGTVRLASGGPWFNVCSLIETDSPATIYPRGFPYAPRRHPDEAVLQDLSEDAATRTVSVNAGLWLLDPDVDAITRLALAPQALQATREGVVLGLDTWSPINTQNTALLREALPAYYYVRMGHALEGMRIDRFGDILSGYLLQKCAKQLGHLVRIGSPVADHKRTPHDLLEDLYHELAGIVLIEELIPWLQSLKVEGDTYETVYAVVADAIEEQASKFTGFVWDGGGRDFLQRTAVRMRTWLGVLDMMCGRAA